jgi:signal transduction histidine kinase
MAMADVLARVSALAPDTVVLMGPFGLDAAGQRFVPRAATASIAAASSAPVYGPSAVLGVGEIVGGQMVSYEAHGRLAAELALRVLQGERPPPIEGDTLVPTFDWRQLRRWQLDERRLPAGSVVLFRPASAWERYRWWILGALTLIALQALLIGALLVQRTRSRRAEAQVRASEATLRTHVDRVQDLAGRLVSAQEEERGRIARELHDDVGQRVASLAIGLSGLQRRLPAVEPGVRDELSHLQQETLGLSKDLRQLSHELHPGVLEHVGLLEALRGRCDEASAEPGYASSSM